jgi:gamma-glutamylcyclotransferase (GGCT)/AIG2-like uncharacterized protein YtfP
MIAERAGKERNWVMNNYFVSWFYVESEGDYNYSPSTGGRSSSFQVQRLYWRMVYSLYKTAMITNREVIDGYIFLSNLKTLPTVDGIDFNQFFKDNNIEFISLELAHITPRDWSGAWRNQFYVYDVMNVLKEREGSFIILDIDVVITGSLKQMYADIEQNGILPLTIEYRPDREVNGCSINDMRAIYEEVYGEKAPDLLYSGGEQYSVASYCIPEILKTFDEIDDVNRRRYEEHKVKLTDDAHYASLIYYRMKRQSNGASKYVKRMWNDLSCDQVVPEDYQLPIWHLPAEKRFGLQQIFDHLVKKEDWTPESVRKLCDRYTWVSKPRWMRSVRWYYRYGLLKIKKLVACTKR